MIILYLNLVITDREAPKLDCIDNQSDPNEVNPSASDNSGSVSVTCDTQSGRPIICKAVDGSGNSAVCSFPVNAEGNMCMCTLILS